MHRVRRNGGEEARPITEPVRCLQGEEEAGQREVCAAPEAGSEGAGVRMKDESDNRSDFIKFDDALSALIDGADTLTIAEVVGVIELQLHVLKCRFHAGSVPPPK